MKGDLWLQIRLWSVAYPKISVTQTQRALIGRFRKVTSCSGLCVCGGTVKIPSDLLLRLATGRGARHVCFCLHWLLQSRHVPQPHSRGVRGAPVWSRKANYTECTVMEPAWFIYDSSAVPLVPVSRVIIQCVPPIGESLPIPVLPPPTYCFCFKNGSPNIRRTAELSLCTNWCAQLLFNRPLGLWRSIDAASVTGLIPKSWHLPLMFFDH